MNCEVGGFVNSAVRLSYLETLTQTNIGRLNWFEIKRVRH